MKISVAPFSSDRLQDGLHPWSGFGLTVYQLRPESRGEIRLKSANPADAPAMYPNYLATETDRRAIVDGLKIGRRVLATSHMQHFITEEYQPGMAVQTDEQLLEHARNTGGTVFHPTSTCKMGVDPMAVVDPELHVHGIEGAARGRCVDHADGDFRQYQCRDDHDRREGCRSGSPATADGGVTVLPAPSSVRSRFGSTEASTRGWQPRGSVHPVIASTCGHRP